MKEKVPALKFQGGDQFLSDWKGTTEDEGCFV